MAQRSYLTCSRTSSFKVILTLGFLLLKAECKPINMTLEKEVEQLLVRSGVDIQVVFDESLPATGQAALQSFCLLLPDVQRHRIKDGLLREVKLQKCNFSYGIPVCCPIFILVLDLPDIEGA